MDVFITLEEHKDTVSRTISEHPALDNSQIDKFKLRCSKTKINTLRWSGN